jgi:hypothetical protein
MATGAYFVALDYKMYVGTGTTASTAPTSGSGLTEVLSLDNVGIQGSSETQQVTDYGSEQGFAAAIVVGQSYTIPCGMNLSLNDPGYKILKSAALNAANGTTLRWYRESPLSGVGHTREKHNGVAFVTDFSEEITAGGVAKVTFSLTGYGAYGHTAATTGT